MLQPVRGNAGGEQIHNAKVKARVLTRLAYPIGNWPGVGGRDEGRKGPKEEDLEVHADLLKDR